MRNTDNDWNLIAESEPYYGVLSEERFLGAKLTPDNKKNFFLSGERDIAHIRNVMASMGGQLPRSGLDFGCGVARLLIPMSRIVEQSYGVDIADGMRNLAQENLQKAGLKNYSLSATIPEVRVNWVLPTFSWVKQWQEKRTFAAREFWGLQRKQ